MNILISNDEGIHARGLRVLADALSSLGEVWVVAPDRERSASGHSLTLNRPLRVTKVASTWFTVDGTPTDCIALALMGMINRKFDLVASGINIGGNMGDDVTYSGTVSAAFEATLLGLPAFAISVAADRRADFTAATEIANAGRPRRAYKAVLKSMGNKPVTIRTFDVGADKALNGVQSRIEPNPALGLRAIRYSLAEPQMFLTQLRALLRASLFGRLKIMIPMLSHAHEIDSTLNLIDRAKAELRTDRIKFEERVEIGGMVEVPAAALALGMFVRRLAFLSIGTNDLIQYTLAIDRADEAVAHLYDPLHPAVRKLIAGTIQVGAKYSLPASVCGEMAGDPAYTLLLLGMGLRQFSMHPSKILEVKQQVLRADLTELAPRVQRILKMDEPAR